VNPDALRLSHVFEQEAAHFARAIAMGDRDAVVLRFRQVADYMKEFATWAKKQSDAILDEGNGSFLVSGKVDVDEVAQRLKVQIEREGFETVGGYLLSHIGRVPLIGERFDIDSLRVEVLDAERRRINKVRISKSEGVEAASDT